MVYRPNGARSLSVSFTRVPCIVRYRAGADAMRSVMVEVRTTSVCSWRFVLQRPHTHNAFTRYRSSSCFGCALPEVSTSFTRRSGVQRSTIKVHSPLITYQPTFVTSDSISILPRHFGFEKTPSHTTSQQYLDVLSRRCR